MWNKSNLKISKYVKVNTVILVSFSSYFVTAQQCFELGGKIYDRINHVSSKLDGSVFLFFDYKCWGDLSGSHSTITLGEPETSGWEDEDVIVEEIAGKSIVIWSGNTMVDCGPLVPGNFKHKTKTNSIF